MPRCAPRGRRAHLALSLVEPIKLLLGRSLLRRLSLALARHLLVQCVAHADKVSGRTTPSTDRSHR
jgi:hypothetical protein